MNKWSSKVVICEVLETSQMTQRRKKQIIFAVTNLLNSL